MNSLKIRSATIDDMPQVFNLVKELAVYENEGDAVKTTVDYYKKSFENGLFQSSVACIADKIVGITIFYPRFSTWKGKMMHLEDFVVSESNRRQGIGKVLFEDFLSRSKEQDCKMVVWDVLNWNTPAIDFYKKYSTKFDNEWSMCKIYFE